MSTVARPSGLAKPRPYTPLGRPDASELQVPATRPAGLRHRRIEGFVIFVVFGAFYGLVGHWLVVDHHIFTFESLNRLSNAYLAWHGVPPKLAAIGFAVPPLESLALLLLAIIPSISTSLIALPISSAVFGGLFVVALNRLLDRCDMGPLWRYPILVLTGLVPTLVFYSASGGAEMISLWLLTAAISGLIAWFRTVDTRFLISSGLAFGLAVMADYGDVVWLLLAAGMVATVLARHGADDAEVEGSIITYLAPTLYAVALWCLINWLILRSPFGWITESLNSTVNVAPGDLAAHPAALTHALADSVRLALDAAPLSLLIAPLLLIVAVLQRNELAGWLVAFTVVAIFRPGAEAILHANIADLQLSMSPPQIMIAVAGAAWLYQSMPAARVVIGLGLIVAMVATIIVVWDTMSDYPYQNMEQAFHETVLHSSVAQTTSRGGLSIGVTEERDMGSYIHQHIHAPGSILTDNSQTYAVIMFADDPSLFRTRLDTIQRTSWYSAVQAPPKRIKYFLIDYRDASDALNASYPNAVNGTLSGLAVVHRNARYVLLSVARGMTARSAGSTGSRGTNSQPTQPIDVNSF